MTDRGHTKCGRTERGQADREQGAQRRGRRAAAASEDTSVGPARLTIRAATGAVLLVCVVGSAAAQSGAASSPNTEAMRRCIEVQIGNEKTLDCYNQMFRREVDRVNPSLNMPPIGPNSTDLQKGLVNVPAVQQQYGPNYGRSVVPYRPTITYGAPRVR